jgi:hypothetical protein
MVVNITYIDSFEKVGKTSNLERLRKKSSRGKARKASFHNSGRRIRIRRTVVYGLYYEAVKKELIRVGAWRSLVAYLNGVQRAGGSNPLAPTN